MLHNFPRFDLSPKNVIPIIIGITVISIFVNVVGSESAMLFGNYAYFPVIGLFLFVTIRTLKKSLASSTTPLMYGTICAYAVTSLIAQTIWTYDEIYLKIETYPSLADVFYLIGCSALLMFFVEYHSYNTIACEVY